MDKIGLLIVSFYREIDLRWLFSHARKRENGCSGKENVDECINFMFDLGNVKFRRFLLNKVHNIYRSNFTHDEFELIIEELRYELFLSFSNTNALFSFFIAANSFLEIELNRVVVKSENFLNWNYLVNRVDSNIVLSAFISNKNGYDINSLLYNTDSIISHSKAEIDSMLELGISENHMHLKGSGYTTEINIFKLFSESPLGSSRLREFVKSTNGFTKYKDEHKNDDELVFCLIKLKLIRLILLSRINDDKTFSDKMIRDILQSIDEDDLDVKINPITIRLAHERFYDRTKVDSDVYWYVNIERKFQISLFERIASKRFSSLEMYITNLYFAGITQVKFEFIQDNLSIGFYEFKNIESKKEHFIVDDENLIFMSVFDKYYREKHVHKLELRIPPSEPSKLTSRLASLERINENKGSKIRYGIIVHFIKDGSKICYDNSISRKSSFLEKTSKETSRILAFLESNKVSGYSPLLVGIDAANFEINCGPEYLAQYFRKIRHEKELSGDLRFTYHVGEDFETLLNGIIAIDEAIEFIDMKSGDRLGHATALVIDPELYFREKNGLYITKIGLYLNSIVWAMEIEGIVHNENLLEYLEKEYMTIVTRIRGLVDFEYSIDDYRDFSRLKSDSPDIYLNDLSHLTDATYDIFARFYKSKINSTNLKHKNAFLNPRARSLYYNYQFNKKTKEVLDFPYTRKIDEKILQVIEISQQFVIQKIHDTNLVIEINPTSNNKISVLKTDSLSFLKLNNCGQNGTLNNKNLVQNDICVNSDDSAIFQTNLCNEYFLMFETMKLSGLSIDEIKMYLSGIMEKSNTCSFVK